MAKFPKQVESLLEKLYDTEIQTVASASRLKFGRIYLFGYIPKTRADLPYWDALPLIMLLGWGKGEILGINLHYIPWAQRINFTKKIMAAGKNRRVKYSDIKKAFESSRIPGALAYLSIRKYLIRNVRTKIKVFDNETWEPVVKNVLPRFQKKQDKFIYSELRKKLRSK
jgi:hypothetical protein